jgi:hypothetical protein
MTDYEYGVALLDDLSDPHRTGMTEAEAREWVASAEGESQMKPGAFKVIRRPVGEWERD